MRDLHDTTIFITGASGGIGGATAHRLAAAGARLALSGRDRAALERLSAELPGGAHLVPADVTDEAQVVAAFEDARAALGHLDVLVNLPGLSVPAAIAEMALADYDRIMDVNVRGLFTCAKHFVRGVDPARGALVVNVSSVAGRQANPNAPVYCAAKAAADMLAKGLALQSKQAGVRVSVVSPGAVSTPGFWGERQVPHELFLQPDDVAELIHCVVALPPRIVCHELLFESFDFYRSK